MPHVVLEGNIDVSTIFEKLEPIMIKDQDFLLKTVEHYINHSSSSILIDCLIIESGQKKQFFAYINNREDGVVIRLYPKLDVEKTEVVKQILVEIAKKLLDEFPSLEVGKTNLNISG